MDNVLFVSNALHKSSINHEINWGPLFAENFLWYSIYLLYVISISFSYFYQ